MSDLTSLLESIIKGFVTKPEEVKVICEDEEHEGKTVKAFHILVAKEDVGLCIGKNGEHMQALRKIISLVGYRKNVDTWMTVDLPRKE